MTIHQDASLYSTILAPGKQVSHPLQAGRHAWVQVIKGSIEVNGSPLQPGDGAAISDEKAVVLKATQLAEALVFDLA